MTPLLDVSELMTDPDFVGPIQIIARTASVNSMGENVIVDAAPIDTVGSVQPTSGKDYHRVPEALRNENLQTFWVKADIAAPENADYPTILVFGGRRFAIKRIGSWSHWGQGYCEGFCVEEALS